MTLDIFWMNNATSIIIHLWHCLSSDWLKARSQFLLAVFGYVIPTDNSFKHVEVTSYLQTIAFMHAEVTLPNTL